MRIEVRFNGWCSRSEQCLGPVHGGKHDCCIPRIVAGSRIVLLVAVFVFFVHNDQSQLAERQKYRRTNTDNDIVTFIVQYIVPDFHPFGIRKPGMIHAQPLAEYPFQAAGELCGECYFGYEVQHLFPRCYHFVDELNVNLGFSAGGDSMQQHHRFFGKLPVNFIHRLQLKFIEGVHFFGGHFRIIQPANFFAVIFKNSAFNQSVDDSR